MSRKKSANIRSSTETAGEIPSYLYRALFDSNQRGIAIARVLGSENAAPSDLTFLDANASFQEQTGMGGAHAKRVREGPLEHELQDRWVGAGGQAVMAGIPQQFEHRLGGRCFEVSIFPLSEKDESLVGIVLEDTTPLERANLELKNQRELLHSITEVLVSTKMQISLTQSAIREPGLRELLEKASRLIDDSIGQSRSQTADINHRVEYESGLIPALTQLAASIEQRFGLRVIVESNLVLKPENQDAAVALFAATRELLLSFAKDARVNEVRVTLFEKDGRIVLSLEDKGGGFEPVLDSKSTRSGSGLTKVRGRLRRVGGDLMVESDPGGGTRVTMSAPASVSRGPDPTAQESGDAALLDALFGAEAVDENDRGVIRVLLVDDHLVLRQGLASLLEGEEGIEVVGQASDGYEAIELARRLRPDVATMDISMPRMNGIEATRQIKSEMPAVRIIGLSMHGEPEQAKLLYEAGVDAYLSKGSPSDELIRTIRRIVRPNTGAS